MKITGHTSVKIKVHVSLLWSKDIYKRLSNSFPIGTGKDENSYIPAVYPAPSSAFIVGGKNLYVEGFRFGTSNGNVLILYHVREGNMRRASRLGLDTPVRF
jgi:galacturan 1,4-alpha-galacturonidase